VCMCETDSCALAPNNKCNLEKNCYIILQLLRRQYDTMTATIKAYACSRVTYTNKVMFLSGILLV